MITKILYLIFIFSIYLTADVQFKQLLDKYCLECHGGKKTKGGVDFKGFSDVNHIYENHDLWQDVILQIAEGEMPPEDEPQMTAAEKTFFEKKIFCGPVGLF